MTDIHMKEREAQLRARQAEEYRRIERQALRDERIIWWTEFLKDLIIAVMAVVVGSMLGIGLSYIL